jgi:PiT family inorganic phosphate transporter
MEITVLIFLSSGLFLGWSLGANDAANVFGTAVGSRMMRFTTAAAICSVFLILGAVISGAGAAHGLGQLGTLNALPGAFMAAFSAALTVYWMTKASLPVSTTQAVVGAIIGWNWFSGSITDLSALFKILGTWLACPILGAVFGALLYKLTIKGIAWGKLHLLRLDVYTRLGLILAGAFGAYSLGANNIANVMGVFVSSSPFTDFKLGNLGTITSVQQLFFIGAVAIGVGVFTYSKRVMMMVGKGLMPLSPVAAWVVVVAQAVVLFLFSSITLEHFLASKGLPTIPLIPVSSSQAVVGAVVGIGLLKGGKGIRWGSLAGIASGWVTTPIIAACVCFVALFFLQNVFNQQVYKEVRYVLSAPVISHLEQEGLPMAEFVALRDREIVGGVDFRDHLRALATLTDKDERRVIAAAELYPLRITRKSLQNLDRDYLSPEQIAGLRQLQGRSFQYRWQLYDALAALTPEWQRKEDTKLNKPFNMHLAKELDYLYNLFQATSESAASGGS